MLGQEQKESIRRGIAPSQVMKMYPHIMPDPARWSCAEAQMCPARPMQASTPAASARGRELSVHLAWTPAGVPLRLIPRRMVPVERQFQVLWWSSLEKEQTSPPRPPQLHPHQTETEYAPRSRNETGIWHNQARWAHPTDTGLDWDSRRSSLPYH